MLASTFSLQAIVSVGFFMHMGCWCVPGLSFTIFACCPSLASKEAIEHTSCSRQVYLNRG